MPGEEERIAAAVKAAEERIKIASQLKTIADSQQTILDGQKEQGDTIGDNRVALAELNTWKEGVDARLDKHAERIETAGKRGLLVGAGGSLTGGGILVAIWELIKAHNGG